ncbi:hypothetical protein [Microbacterium sp. 18062]|uniref:hypothetical protein n=1 Tax=Microbacterium sp. 18062 TaxID=2681410 RepID=UPI001358A900|nr:hypothetical protein [Microbacterium sp. 18062]
MNGTFATLRAEPNETDPDETEPDESVSLPCRASRIRDIVMVPVLERKGLYR